MAPLAKTYPTDSANPATKRWGHRTCTPEETLAWLTPNLTRFGITRVAEITGLDTIGIPVFQAVRPMGRSLSVSQGKGRSKMAAKVSAVMEAIEVWHAEVEGLPRQYATAAALGRKALMTAQDLPTIQAGRFDPNAEMGWIKARDLGKDQIGLVPGDAANMDFTRQALPVGLARSTTGLAGGNTKAEARASALAEVIERACQAEFLRAGTRQHSTRRLDPEVIARACPVVADLIRLIQNAGVHIDLHNMTNRFGVTAIRAVLYRSKCHAPTQMPAVGHGAHLDPVTAIGRAITEAAQARLTYIAGNRDDLNPAFYDNADVPNIARLLDQGMDLLASRRGLDLTDQSGFSADQDGEIMLERILSNGAGPVVEVDLTQEKIGIPVVKILAPNVSYLACS